MDREKLYDRINKRVDLMLEKGLVKEVEKLVEMDMIKYDCHARARVQGNIILLKRREKP